MDNYDIFIADKNIRETSQKYQISPVRFRILLLIDIVQKPMPARHFLNHLNLYDENLYQYLLDLISKEYIYVFTSKMPKTYFLTEKGQKVVNSFKKAQKRSKRTLSKDL